MDEPDPYRCLLPRWRATHADPNSTRRLGVTLIELLVVLFIIGVLISLMFPALQSARAKARATECQNHVRQLGFALHNHLNTARRFPEPNEWTHAVLKWIEEWPLAEEVAGGVPEGTELPRPRLLICPAQPNVESTVPGSGVCHYVLTVDRPIPSDPRRVRWDLHDRERLSEQQTYEPWYVGPEISFAQQQELFSANLGPHPGGVFYNRFGPVGGSQ